MLDQLHHLPIVLYHHQLQIQFNSQILQQIQMEVLPTGPGTLVMGKLVIVNIPRIDLMIMEAIMYP